MARYIIRIDDVHSQMNWNKFMQLLELLNKYNCVPLIGVIPNNQDKSINSGDENVSFWKDVEYLHKNNKIQIAMHGYEHRYTTKTSGLLSKTRIKAQSEFAGLSYDIQLEMLQKGKEILYKNNLDTDIFMAPGHTFDDNTVKALKTAGFTRITDGIGIYPYKIHDVILVPQQMAIPRSIPFGGIYTICVHTDNINQNFFDKMEAFLRKNTSKIIPFNDLTYDDRIILKLKNFISQKIMVLVYRVKRR